jgi:ATPase subunit of ABC transporter with duplicated ATPase domains
MLASTQAKERQANANAKAKERVADLQEFVRRFSANKSKARQATSRMKMIDKIKIEDFKPSSRQNPYIRFEGEKKLHRLAVEVEHLAKSYEQPVIRDFSIMVEAGEKIAIVGANGAGKTTLLSCTAQVVEPDHGRVRWAENANPGLMPQDPSEFFSSDENLTDWMGRWTQEGDDDQSVRGMLGRLLFSGDEVKKPVKVLSGGEKGRMMFGKLMLGRHNVLLMDEPTNHMDMESIESLNLALDKYAGTLLFVSHDREFVNSLATRVLEVRPEGIADFHGTYDQYLASQGVDQG